VADETRACLHCGTTFKAPPGDDREFCCNGCAYVYRLIHDEGLDRYYDLRDRPIHPVPAGALQSRDYTWLAGRAAAAEAAATRGAAELLLDLQGISCIGCVWLVEKVFMQREGAVRIEVDAQLGQLRMRWIPGLFDMIDFARTIQRFGYLLGPAGQREQGESKRLMGRLAASAAFALNAMMFTLPRYLGMGDDFELAPLFLLLTVLFATLSVLTGGSYFIARAAASLRHGVLHIDLPIALGIVGAYVGSIYGLWRADESFLYFDFVAIFVFLMLLGRWVQERAVESNRNRMLRDNPRPDAITRADGTHAAIEELARGDRYLILPGQPAPVRSTLCSPAAEMSMEWINGESEPRSFSAGGILPSGSIHIGRDPIEAEALERWPESLLFRLLQRSATSWRNLALERILRVYLIAVFVLAALGGGAWWLVGGALPPALQVMLSILVVSCPCALGVSHPLAAELAVARLRRSGLFVRDGTLFPRLARIRKIIFDKTGTLTLEAPRLENPAALATLDPAARAALAAMVADSLHPVARSLREALLALADTPQLPVFNALTETPGMGIYAHDGTHAWTLGRSGWRGAEPGANAANAAGAAVAAVTEFARDGTVVASFRFADALRDDAREEVQKLARRFAVYLLSGDHPAKVNAMAAQLGLPAEAAIGGQSPVDKAEWVQRIDESDTLFIGDGANDSLAFDRAACRGTPVVDKSMLEEKADFFFTGRGIACVRELFEVAATRRRALRQVFAFAVAYNVLAVAICLAGKMNPLAAAILMPLSSLITLGLVAAHFRPQRGRSTNPALR